MAYEYGCIITFGGHDACDDADTLEEAMRQCELLQRDWNGEGIGKWEFNGTEWRGQSDNPDEPWYIREVRE